MRSRDATRDLLLETGRSMLLERGLSEMIDMKITDVLTEVGLTTGAAYNIWETQDDFRRDLALHVAQSFSWADQSAVIAAVASLPADATLTDWVSTVADTYFPLFVGNRSFFVILHFWGVRNPSPELVRAIQDGYDVVHASFVDLYQFTLDWFGYEPIENFNISDLTAMVTAALEGFALRHRFQPEHVSNDEGLLFTSLLKAIAAVYLQPVAE